MVAVSLSKTFFSVSIEVYDFSSNELIGSIPTHVGLLSELREYCKDFCVSTVLKLKPVAVLSNTSCPCFDTILCIIGEFNIGGNLGLNGTIPSELSQLLQLGKFCLYLYLWLFNRNFHGVLLICSILLVKHPPYLFLTIRAIKLIGYFLDGWRARCDLWRGWILFVFLRCRLQRCNERNE